MRSATPPQADLNGKIRGRGNTTWNQPKKPYKVQFTNDAAGQMLEHAPYSERDIRVPELLETHTERGSFEVRVKVRDHLTRHELDHHPFDVVGWDGYLYPWIFNISDFEPITGRVHQPPPAHQCFQGHNFVVCSFVPRLFDYHPEAIPVPYNHSNVNSDEVIYYAEGNVSCPGRALTEAISPCIHTACRTDLSPA